MCNLIAKRATIRSFPHDPSLYSALATLSTPLKTRSITFSTFYKLQGFINNMSTSTPTKHYLVLFVTDYRKEHDFRAHKTFLTKEAAIEEAKKFTDPPVSCKDPEDGGSPFEWEYTCPSSNIIFADNCRVDYDTKETYEGGAVFNMSWNPVVTVVEVAFEGR